MEIRKIINYRFTGIVGILLMISLLVIYILFAVFRKDEFKDRLINKTKSIAQLIAETESVESGLLERIEKNNPTSLPNERILAFNGKNEIIFKSGINSTFIHSDSLIQRAIKEKLFYQRVEETETVGIYYKGTKEKVVVICSAHDVFGFRKLRKLGIILLTVFFISLLLVFYIGYKFSANALSPISDVINQVKKIDISCIYNRVKAGNGKDEIAILAGTFNNMLERLETAFEVQKDFIANASHELRTPLTAITGQIEVCLMQGRNTSEYKKVLTSVLEDIKSLNKLTNHLLIILRAESTSVDRDFELFRIDDILWSARAEILKLNSNYLIDIAFDESIDGEHHFQILGNRELLKSTFINIIDNGCKYSTSNQVNISLAVHNSSLEVKFTDKGIGIPKEEIESVFQPFYRATNTTNKKGHGIGLSIVEKIIAIHNGTVNISSIIEKGTTVTLLLPLA